LKGVLRAILVVVCLVLICIVLFVCLAVGQEPPVAPPVTFQISGTVRSGKTPLPGVTVTALNTLTGKKISVASALDGSFLFKGLSRGRYVVKVEFMGFATQTQEVVLNRENPVGKVETELILASRQQEEVNRVNNTAAAARGFQSLEAEGTFSTLSTGALGNGSGNGNFNASDLSSLPMSGAGAEGATESVSVTGARGRTKDFGNGNEEELQQRIQEFRDRAQQGGGGFGGFIGGGPQGGGGVIGRMGGRGFNLNQPHGFLYFQDDDAGLDARSYSLTGLQSEKASYKQVRFGAFVGGPVKIPHLFDWSKTTFFTAGWNGARGTTPFDMFSTVPTGDERKGIFTGLTERNGNPVVIYDPQTGQPFANNSIDPSRFSSASKALLAYIPEPQI